MKYNKKLIIYLVIFIIALLICFGVIYLYLVQKDELPEDQTLELTEKEKTIQRQLEELDALRQETNRIPLTKEEQEKQLLILDELYKERGSVPFSQEEQDKQIEELDNLRSR